MVPGLLAKTIHHDESDNKTPFVVSKLANIYFYPDS